MPSAVKFDPIYEDSEIEDGATLFRVTSPLYADRTLLLNGKGTNTNYGRFHRPTQPTSYLSDNVLLCFAEKLFYMSRAAIRKLKNLSYGEFRGEATKDCILSIFECHHIPNLVHIESSAALIKHQLNPSTLIHPDQTYDPLQHAADSIRADNKQGIVYLSARHSEGIAIALFGDHGGAIKALTATVRVRLSLISEDRTLKVEDKYFDPTRMRVSHSVGHFMIDAADFSRCEYLLQPILTSTHGYLDFFRIHYKGRYPQTAVSIR